ncbi:hypothetical protein DFH94DRAFT_852090, partial [Russula ochroleuca]
MLALRDSPGTVNEYVALVTFWLTVTQTISPSGSWEFVSTLPYEWKVIRGSLYRWAIWVYSTARLATLMTVILNMISFFGASPINCQAWVTSTWVSIPLTPLTPYYDRAFCPGVLI